ncbi:MAG: hypothetical protein QOH61_1453 [Chloroflexota bacterium]|jgi:hypothetical protein|nr:hypothetical protein [Chloroflexota bacterium]
MSVSLKGVQRTPVRSSLGPLIIGVLATFLAVGTLVGTEQPAAAATTSQANHRPKIVIVVGATEQTTARYRSIARKLANQARRYGAIVKEVYSPRATWGRVTKAARGANMLVYLGHGNGWPSRYAPFQTRTKDGMGLNRTMANSDYNTEYYGEAFLEKDLHLARNAVVLLVHLCYASGAAEWGSPNPSLSVAKSRVDNYGAGFLRTGARAVIAEGFGQAGYLLKGLFTTNKTIRQIFWSSPLAVGKFAVSFNPRRSPGWASGILDPHRPSNYYRSVVGKLNMRASDWRN